MQLDPNPPPPPPPPQNGDNPIEAPIERLFNPGPGSDIPVSNNIPSSNDGSNYNMSTVRKSSVFDNPLFYWGTIILVILIVFKVRK